MDLGLILLANDRDRVRLTHFSHGLQATGGWQMKLGPSALPHLTLMHFRAEPATTEAIWKEFLAEWPDRRVEVRTAYLAVAHVEAGNFYVPEGGVSVSAGVTMTPSLVAAFSAASSAVARHGEPLTSVEPGNYWPHVTLGVTCDNEYPTVFSSPSNLRDTVSMWPAIAKLGPFGTFSDVLAVPPEPPTDGEADS